MTHIDVPEEEHLIRQMAGSLTEILRIVAHHSEELTVYLVLMKMACPQIF